MPKINWSRLILGSLIAAIILFVTDGFVHEAILRNDWRSVYAGLHATMPAENAVSMVYFAIFELGRGFIAMMFYATMRAYFGAGPKTAVLAGVVAWVAFSLTGPAQFIPLGFLSNALWVKISAIQFVTTILATIAGAALYKDATGHYAERVS